MTYSNFDTPLNNQPVAALEVTRLSNDPINLNYAGTTNEPMQVDTGAEIGTRSARVSDIAHGPLTSLNSSENPQATGTVGKYPNLLNFMLIIDFYNIYAYR